MQCRLEGNRQNRRYSLWSSEVVVRTEWWLRQAAPPRGDIVVLGQMKGRIADSGPCLARMAEAFQATLLTI